jgi:hypothetical protein
MDPWKSQSGAGKQLGVSIGCAAVGLAMTLAFDHTFRGGVSDSNAGFLLGLLLLGIGIAGLVFQGSQTVVVDSAARAVVIEDRTLLGAKRRIIPFREISGVQIGRLGKKSNFAVTYYLDLLLQNGERYPLFAPGRFYEGASDRSVVEGWRSRLESYLRQSP